MLEARPAGPRQGPQPLVSSLPSLRLGPCPGSRWRRLSERRASRAVSASSPLLAPAQPRFPACADSEWQGWECPDQGHAGGTREAPELWAPDLEEGCLARLVVPFGCFLLTLPGERPGRKWCQVESALLFVVLSLW